MKRDTDTNAARTSRGGELGTVLERAQELCDSTTERSRVDWSYAAAHVGDLSVLALAFAGER
jgi:hypothetical protein